MPVRGRAIRDGVPRVLGFARSQSRQPTRAGAVCATYVGTWRKRFRITAGECEINRFKEKETGAVRSFCRRCVTPLVYERTRSQHMINIPRALFQSRTGRQPIYHIGIEEMQDWAYAGEPLVSLKGYPGVFWKRSKKKGRVEEAHFSGSIRSRCS